MPIEGTGYEKFTLAKRQYNSYIPVPIGTDTVFAQRTYMEGSLSVGTIEIGAVELKDDSTTARARILAPASITGTMPSLAVYSTGGTLNSIPTVNIGTFSPTINVNPSPAATAIYGSVNIGTAATQITAGSSTLRDLIIYNDTGAYLYVGTNNSVGTATGFKRPNQAEWAVNTSAPIWGILASGTGNTYYWQEA